MYNYNRFVGLDVHKDSIAVAVADSDGGLVRGEGIIPNKPESVRKMVNRLGRGKQALFGYEAGPCGYNLYRQIKGMGCGCIVAATSLIPTIPGERVKTDRRDAEKLARLLRSGGLTPVWVPDEEHEAFRDLIRLREDIVRDLMRDRNRLSKFLLRQRLMSPEGIKNWSSKYHKWLEGLRFERAEQQVVLREYLDSIGERKERLKRVEEEIRLAVKGSKQLPLINALQGLRGVGLITAATLVAEIGEIGRFDYPSQLMSYVGLVPSEFSSGSSHHRGRITRTGNSQARMALVESAWHYRHSPKISDTLRKRQRELGKEIKEISWKAQNRLNRRYREMVGRYKPSPKVIVGIARELLGFIWAIARVVEGKPVIMREAA